MAFPAAEGVRSDWDAVPETVRGAVADVCGSAVVSAATQRGGFSPGVAARVVCASGDRVFIKLVAESVNAHTAALHRSEVVALQAISGLSKLPAPRLLGAVDADGWTGLVVTDVDGRTPALPWRKEELTQVLAATARIGATGAPRVLPTAAELLLEQFSGWRTLLADPPGHLDGWAAERLPELAELEARWPQAAEGDRLLHGDLRADNVLLTESGAVVVDWPEACRGAALLDLVLLAPSVAMQGGPAPRSLLASTLVGRDADPTQLLPLVCAFAGYLTQRSLQPPPAGLPTLRGFQAAQAVEAVRWLVQLMDDGFARRTSPHTA